MTTLSEFIHTGAEGCHEENGIKYYNVISNANGCYPGIDAQDDPEAKELLRQYSEGTVRKMTIAIIPGKILGKNGYLRDVDRIATECGFIKSSPEIAAMMMKCLEDLESFKFITIMHEPIKAALLYWRKIGGEKMWRLTTFFPKINEQVSDDDCYVYLVPPIEAKKE